MHVKKMNLMGHRFGRLLVVGEAESNKGNHARWLCRCDCGTEKVIPAAPLRSGATVSCGCYSKDVNLIKNTKHGMYKYSGYGSWKAMMERCHTRPQCKDFARYGGRGIKVCERWHDVRNFAADMGDKKRGQSIDRLDPNGDYCPENCRWTDAMGQGENKRNNHLLRINGEVMRLREACRKYDINESTLGNRLTSGMAANDAANKPVRPYDRTVTCNGLTLTIAHWAERNGLKAHTIRWRIRHGLDPAMAVMKAVA